jgi:nucleotide-binding universal stress UspA family protein
VRNVVVGVDGSESSIGALDWAAETVGRAGRIHAVVGLNPWTRYVADAVGGREVAFEHVLERDLANRWTAEAGFRVGELRTTVSVSTAAQALDEIATADRADAIVVGAHTSMLGVPARVGRTINHLIRTTDHPVVVVPGRPPVAVDDGVVVVGIGHGNATRAAVRWAAHLARERGLTVELLHATGDAPVFQAGGVLELVRYEIGREDPDEFAQGSIEHFAELMQTLAGPELDLVVSTPPGLAALRLDEASERSALLVLGRHRSGWDRGHHTAQPLRHALTHARCPVVVIADHPDWLADA